MDSSVLLLAAVGLSLANLLPHALRRRQQLSSCRSVDRSSAAMRILKRRTPSAAPSSGVDRRPVLLMSPRLDLPGDAGTGRALSTSAVRVVADRRSGRRVSAALPASALVLSVVALVAVAVLAQQAVLPPWAVGAGVGQVAAVVLALRLRACRRAAGSARSAQPTAARPLTAAVAVPSARTPARELVPARRPA